MKWITLLIGYPVAIMCLALMFCVMVCLIQFGILIGWLQKVDRKN